MNNQATLQPSFKPFLEAHRRATISLRHLAAVVGRHSLPVMDVQELDFDEVITDKDYILPTDKAA